MKKLSHRALVRSLTHGHLVARERWELKVVQREVSDCSGPEPPPPRVWVSFLVHDVTHVSCALSISTSDISIYQVLLGALQLQQPGPHALYVPVKRVKSNPEYRGMASSADVALVELQVPVTFTKYILPVCVPDPSIIFESGMNCWVTGWGSPSEQGEGTELGEGGR